MELTEQEQSQVTLGIAAERLLADETFGFVVNELANQYMNNIVQSGPDAGKERESMYFSIKALQDVNSVLKQWSAVKENIIAMHGDSDSEE